MIALHLFLLMISHFSFSIFISIHVNMFRMLILIWSSWLYMFHWFLSNSLFIFGMFMQAPIDNSNTLIPILLMISRSIYSYLFILICSYPLMLIWSLWLYMFYWFLLVCLFIFGMFMQVPIHNLNILIPILLIIPPSICPYHIYADEFIDNFNIVTPVLLMICFN